MIILKPGDNLVTRCVRLCEQRQKAPKSQFGSIHQSIRLNAASGNACDSLLRAHCPTNNTNNARASRWEVGNGNGQAP